ncbi:enoyl-CoA hydratase/isomerase family protein [Patulibacter defluvii]|uniref:enoyl-CoA hydratase/isomerase family protein n=1 Tax=Patulibacter defluvii TaxID=3095358 RepID=UPI002A7652E0|nr:enoyl-CoA hydratase-related protein [Patulibacter sp. DM4]
MTTTSSDRHRGTAGYLRYEGLVAQGQRDSAVDVRRDGARVDLVLGDGQRLNTLIPEIVVPLREALERFGRDPEVRAIVVRGGGQAFSAGGDLAMMEAAVRQLRHADDRDGTASIWRWIRREFGGVVRAIARSEAPVIAAVDGPAAGVGLAFALASDLVVATDRAVLVPAFGRIGLVPEVGTSWTMTRALGRAGAFARYLTGEPISAAEALDLGLVQEVVPAAELDAAVDRWVGLVAAQPEQALQLTKVLLRQAADSSWDHALVAEEFAEPQCFVNGDFADAIHRFPAAEKDVERYAAG